MSHFTVLVIGDNPEEQLYPYDEQPDAGSELLKFNNVEDEYRPKYEAETTTRIRSPEGELLLPWDKRFQKPGSFGFGSDTHFVPEGYEEVEVPLKELYKSFDEFMVEYGGYSKDDETGKYGYFHNPNAKWDWYSLGGRWTGFFKLKPGAKGSTGRPGLMTEGAKAGWVDQAYKKDIDFEGMFTEAIIDAEANWSKAELETNPGEKYWRYGVRDTDTKESYIKRCSNGSVVTFALLKDGKWYEKGEMGWFAMVRDEKDENAWSEEFAKLLEDLPDDTLLSLYDCHI